MKRYLAWIPLLALVAVVPLGCGNDSSKDQSADIDVPPVNPAVGEDFHPFDEAPVLVAYEAPVYPEEAKRQGLEGSVVLTVVVDVDGTVESAAVLKSSDEVFNQAALDAVKRSRFEPAKLDGQPTKSQVAIPYQFKLTG